MPTTFHITNFKNKTVNILTGVGVPTPISVGWMNVYNGAQPADPSVSPAGSAVYSAVTSAIPLTSGMTAAGSGISSLNGTKAASASSTVTSLTFARIFDTSSQPLIDCSVGTGSGSAIISSLSASVGNSLSLSQFSLKLPGSNGTLLLGQALNDRLVDVWTGNSSTRPDLGINATIDLYTGSAPATADATATGTLVATFSGNAVNWFNAAAGGSASLASNPVVTASGTGTATYFRWYKTVSNITFTIQGSVGTSGADMIVSNVALTSGVTACSITELTISI